MLGWSYPETLAARLWTHACALPVAGCIWSEGMKRQRISGVDTKTELALPSQHAWCFVSWLLHCTPRWRPCFLLVSMFLHCHALPLYPRRSNGPVLVAVANANALRLPPPPNPGWPVSPFFWLLRQAVGHLRQPWDPPDRARHEPRLGVRCPVTPVDGMTSGYDHNYDYILLHPSPLKSS